MRKILQKSQKGQNLTEVIKTMKKHRFFIILNNLALLTIYFYPVKSV